MNNLSSYCGLIDARISASEKDLPVRASTFLDSKNSLLRTHHKLSISEQLLTLQIVLLVPRYNHSNPQWGLKERAKPRTFFHFVDKIEEINQKVVKFGPSE